MNDLVTVIIPIYNAESFLERCIKSIINQTYVKLQILLINDGSTDGSIFICKKYKEKDNRIEIIDKTNSGVSNSRNIGIENAIGQYITFVDSDDYLENTMIEKLLLAMKNNNVDIVSCRFFYEKNLHKFKSTTINEKIFTNNEFIIEILKENSIIGSLWGKLYRKELFNKIKLNENLKICEDLDLLLRMSDYIQRAYIINECLYNYYINENSVTNSSNIDKFDDELFVLESNIRKNNQYLKWLIIRYIKINLNLFFHYKNINFEYTNKCKLNVKKYKFNLWILMNLKFRLKIKYILIFID